MLTSRWRYALRAMAELAAAEPHPRTAAQIAAALGAEGKYIQAILSQLTVHELATSGRGRTGGYRLRRPAAEIRLIEILAAAEPDFSVSPCRQPVRRRACDGCAGRRPCPIRSVFAQADDAFVAVLRARVLADLIPTAGPLAGGSDTPGAAGRPPSLPGDLDLG